MKTIAVKEFVSDVVSNRFIIVLTVITLLFLVSFMLMFAEYSARVSNYDLSRSVRGSDLWYDTLYAYSFGEGEGGVGLSTTLPPMGRIREPNPLIFFARGLDKKMRQAIQMRNVPAIQIDFEPDQESVLFRHLFPAPDLMFTVSVGLSLIALLYSCGMVSAERQAGTLKLMLSMGASRSAIIVGKTLGGLASLFAAFTVGWLVYLLLFMGFVTQGLSGEEWIRVGGLYAVSLFLILVFFSLGVLISAFTRRPATSLVISLFCWAMLVFILPGLAAVAGKYFIPVWSEQQLSEHKYETAQRLEEEYGRAHPDAPRMYIYRFGAVYEGNAENLAQAMDALEEENRNQHSLLADLTADISRLSPAGSFARTATNLACTGLEDEKVFVNDLANIKSIAYQKVVEFLHGDYNGPQETEISVPDDRRAALTEFLDSHQDYVFNSTDLTECLLNSALDAGLICLWAAAFYTVALIRFINYDVR